MDPRRKLPPELSAFPQNARSAGVFIDFDGTLAPIVDDPTAARPLPGMAEVLALVAQRYARAGVISGRPGAFLATHLGGLGVALAGLYGLEVVTPSGVRPSPAAAAWRPVVARVAAEAEAELPPAIGVERKDLSVALHYRISPEHRGVAEAWAAEASTRSGLQCHAGRMSSELRPPVPHDKGMVLAEWAAGLTHVLFVGDDRGDLEAFGALDELAEGGLEVPARVAVRSFETPAELLERADVVVEGPEGVLDLLLALAEA